MDGDIDDYLPAMFAVVPIVRRSFVLRRSTLLRAIVQRFARMFCLSSRTSMTVLASLASESSAKTVMQFGSSNRGSQKKDKAENQFECQLIHARHPLLHAVVASEFIR